MVNVTWLSHFQRAVLVEHVNGSVPVKVKPAGLKDRHHVTVCTLVRKGLLRFEGLRAGWPGRTSTHLTDAGRDALCAVLAEYAEALVAAGLTREALQPLDFWLVAAE